MQNLHLKGRHKIQDNWMDIIYIVTKRLNEEGSVYRVVPEDGSREAKVLHWMHLRLAPGKMAQQLSEVESACGSHVSSESRGHGSVSASRSPKANGSVGPPSRMSDGPDPNAGYAEGCSRCLMTRQFASKGEALTMTWLHWYHSVVS